MYVCRVHGYRENVIISVGADPWQLLLQLFAFNYEPLAAEI